jgi:hypothetical protein
MYVFVIRIIILVVVILGNLPLPNALGPACYYDWPQLRPKGEEEIDSAKKKSFFIDHKIGEKEHTHPFLRKEI